METVGMVVTLGTVMVVEVLVLAGADAAGGMVSTADSTAGSEAHPATTSAHTPPIPMPRLTAPV
ncbi:hypothetical protein YM304_15110 [Ilumatobacter coccineus YM16-304]|uniref:Uncharacterized protein n=1 Tax=Ilumatobacter coccineus (strain NBRC 103263 / KCTC 29153 / YM16-304) TaxID=1313172 RepID=A0A6C7E9J1_ILUCY|nr:hypothetical protein YM304_15110 [Ilumatobacter coccineus YM16-304]